MSAVETKTILSSMLYLKLIKQLKIMDYYNDGFEDILIQKYGINTKIDILDQTKKIL